MTKYYLSSEEKPIDIHDNNKLIVHFLTSCLPQTWQIHIQAFHEKPSLLPYMPNCFIFEHFLMEDMPMPQSDNFLYCLKRPWVSK